MKENGSDIGEKAMEHKYGKTVPSTKAIGKITKHKVSASLTTSTVMSTLASGTSIRQMVSESIIMLMEVGILETGRAINLMVSVMKHGLTVPNIQEHTVSAERMDLVSISGKMARSMLGTGNKIRSLELAYTNG